ncbi:MAG: ASKHA domain-containing protein [Desulfitobacteriaceae bacterium]
MILQLAKAAMRAGIDILLTTAGVEVQDIEQVLLAGAFGNYIDIHTCLTTLDMTSIFP